MRLQEVTYARVLNSRGDLKCIVQGDNLKMLKNIQSSTVDNIKDGIIMPFSKINQCLHTQLDELEYIKFWENVKIYIVK